MSNQTAVDGEVIHNVAQKYGMGAGALKGLLQSEHLEKYDEDSREIQAVEEAYDRQRKRNNDA